MRLGGGFTLIEVLVAAVILTICGVVISSSVTSALSSMQLAKDFQKAAELADNVMTKVDLIGPSRLSSEGPTEGTFEPPDDRFTWALVIEPQLEADLYKITATVSWATASGSRSTTVETLINDPAGSRNELLDWEGL